MTVDEARQLGMQTASEDRATRGDGSTPPAAYVRTLAQRWAIRQMFRHGADVPTAKAWESAFLAGYEGK